MLASPREILWVWPDARIGFACSAAESYGRDRRLFHHVRGLLAARRDDAAAIAEFQAALFPPERILRTNYELARVFMRNVDRATRLPCAAGTSRTTRCLNLYRIARASRLADAWRAAHGVTARQLITRSWQGSGLRRPAVQLRAVPRADSRGLGVR